MRAFVAEQSDLVCPLAERRRELVLTDQLANARRKIAVRVTSDEGKASRSAPAVRAAHSLPCGWCFSRGRPRNRKGVGNPS
jgi:hypothetical protein